MAEIIGVRFKKGGKIYYFQPNEEELDEGSFVIVETIRGTECGEVVMGVRELPDENINHELKKIIRKATNEDLKKVEDNKRKSKRAFDICNEKIKEHGLEMNLLEVEYTFDGSKILFNFSADGRVDFRELVKDLASIFRTRIELRQIGVRDEAKMLGGLGVCGRPFCCHQFMGEFQSVSIKMAKEQGLSLNPIKISGTCGRLMCCLKHEQDVYDELLKEAPPIGAMVATPDGRGIVTEQELIAGNVRVRLKGNIETPPKTYKIKQVRVCDEADGDEFFFEDDEYSPLKFDEPESEQELEMLDELEKMESVGEESVSSSRRKYEKGGYKRGRQNYEHGNYDDSSRNRPKGEHRNNNHRGKNSKPNNGGGNNGNYNRKRDNEYSHSGKPNNSQGKYKGKPKPKPQGKNTNKV